MLDKTDDGASLGAGTLQRTLSSRSPCAGVACKHFKTHDLAPTMLYTEEAVKKLKSGPCMPIYPARTQRSIAHPSDRTVFTPMFRSPPKLLHASCIGVIMAKAWPAPRCARPIVTTYSFGAPKHAEWDKRLLPKHSILRPSRGYCV